MRQYFAAAVLALCTQQALAAPCYKSQVQDSAGAILTLSSGFTYDVYPGRDTVSAETWLPLQNLRVCRYGGDVDQITNLSLRHPFTILALRRFP